MENQLTTIGSATRDIFLIPKKVFVIDNKDDLTCQKLMAFEYGAKETVEYLSFHPGGTAINVAVGLKRQGINTATLCAVGDDESGKAVLETLKKEGVDISLVKVIPGGNTDRSLDKSAGQKLKINCSSIQSDSIFVSSLKYNWEKKFKELERCATTFHKRLFFTPGTNQVKAGMEKMENFLKQVEVIFLNEDEAIEITRQQTKKEIKEIMAAIYQHGPKIVVVTSGAEGVYIYDGKNFSHLPSKKIKIKDATGAGDAFVAGFLAVYLKEGPLKIAAENGIRNAVSVITHIGTLEGLLRS